MNCFSTLRNEEFEIPNRNFVQCQQEWCLYIFAVSILNVHHCQAASRPSRVPLLFDRMLVLNPAWPHFVCISALLFACFLGLIHYGYSQHIIHSFREFWPLLFKGWADPMHCGALLNDGSWLDARYQNWQPDGMWYLCLWMSCSSSLRQDACFINIQKRRLLRVYTQKTSFLSEIPFPANYSSSLRDH